MSVIATGGFSRGRDSSAYQGKVRFSRMGSIFLKWFKISLSFFLVSSSPPPHSSILAIELFPLLAIVTLAFSLLSSSVLVICVSTAFYFCLGKWMDVAKAYGIIQSSITYKHYANSSELICSFSDLITMESRDEQTAFIVMEFCCIEYLCPQWDLTNINIDTSRLLKHLFNRDTRILEDIRNQCLRSVFDY